jgi:predicted anti-sigma-YlaC factor YlaD
MTALRLLLALVLALTGAACSLRSYAIRMVGDALASGESVYESEDDLELVGQALPFGLKLTESLLASAPDDRGLLLAAARGYALYSYAYVAYEAEILRDQDLDRSLALRDRAHRLYLRAVRYGFRGLEQSCPGLEAAMVADPQRAVAAIGRRHKKREVPLLYWTAAALGLAIASAPEDPAMLARLPEVEAMLDRALALDEAWDAGALHEFKVTFAGAKPGAPPDPALIKQHYARALDLSHGLSAGLYVAYAEAVSLPARDRVEFRAMLERAIAVDPDRQPDDRLATLVAQRRARWLLGRIDDLIAEPRVSRPPGGGQ